jgi:putative membrane protein
MAGTALKDLQMTHAYWNDWYFGWGWMLWIGFVFLIFSGLGNWGYTYRAHQRYGASPGKDARDILNERYARGDISSEDFARMKTEIFEPTKKAL